MNMAVSAMAVSALADILDTAGDSCLERVRADEMAALLRCLVKSEDAQDDCSSSDTGIGSIFADFAREFSGRREAGVSNEAKIAQILAQIRAREGNAAVAGLIKEAAGLIKDLDVRERREAGGLLRPMQGG